jgi:hypothetical protein
MANGSKRNKQIRNPPAISMHHSPNVMGVAPVNRLFSGFWFSTFSSLDCGFELVSVGCKYSPILRVWRKKAGVDVVFEYHPFYDCSVREFHPNGNPFSFSGV